MMMWAWNHLGLLTILITTLAQAVRLKENAAEQSNSTVPVTLFSELEELARLVDISYCVGSTGVHSPFRCLSRCDDFEGFELLNTWNTGPLLSDSCGYIALSHPPFPKRIIVAFRGTYSLTNTIVDLSAVPQEYVPYPAGDDDELDDHSFAPFQVISSEDSKKCKNCTIHAGFWSSWKNARKTILTTVSHAKEQYPDYKLVLVGHSLGGAVAALAGLEMSLRGSPDVEVTTFGEPKVGNAEFADYLNEVFDLPNDCTGTHCNAMRYRRVTHVNDPVPLLPVTEWGYSSHAGEIYISKPDLPYSVADLELCDGNDDKRCIAGAETSDSLNFLTHMISSSAVLSPFEIEFMMQQEQQQTDKVKTQWSLIPAQYRLWELFFAHRDYFWRLGHRVPGGDPGSWRWGRSLKA